MNKKYLIEYLKDHYKHFKCFPLEYEDEKGNVYTFEQYIKHVSFSQTVKICNS